MVNKTKCEKCIKNEHTKEQHLKEKKKEWYEKNNYRYTARFLKRISRGSTNVYCTQRDKESGINFGQLLKLISEDSKQ